MSFGQVLTVVNLRRVEIACLLNIITRVIEYATGFNAPLLFVEIPVTVVFLLASLLIRRSGSEVLARGFVILFVIAALFAAQWSIAAMGAQGRLTSGYPMMLLSLTLLFVAPPRILVVPLAGLLASFCLIVLGTPTTSHEQAIAIANTAVVTLIAIVAAALIHAARRRDYEQKREIRVQNCLLLDRNSELDSLMAITAHDLRSPLYGLRNLFDLAVRRAPGEPGLPLVVLEQAIPSLDAMLALATRLLDAHAAEHEPLPRLSDDDVRAHVAAAAGRVTPLAQSMGVKIVVNLPEQPLLATIEAGALAQILDNLLSNAVRFGPADGTVLIAAGRVGSVVEIRVEDDGPGIAAAARGQLFRRFHRPGGGTSEALPGKGIGLFIVATLAERIGASVRCDPPSGNGATFIVSLRSGPRSSSLS